MPAANASDDLKQVSALFNEYISVVRSRPLENMDALATEWIKNARFQLMTQIEDEFRKLSESIGDPLKLPRWATELAPLRLFTVVHNHTMNPYKTVFTSEFQTLLDDCGFSARIECNTGVGNNTFYIVNITFPTTIPSSSVTTEVTRTFKNLPKISATILRFTEAPNQPATEQPVGASMMAAKAKRSAASTRKTKAGNRASDNIKAKPKGRQVKASKVAKVTRNLKLKKTVTNTTAEDEAPVAGPSTDTKTRRRSARLDAP